MTKLKALLTLDEAATNLRRPRSVAGRTMAGSREAGEISQSGRGRGNLTGQPLNWQFVERKAKLIETTHTGPGYRLYALADNSPAKPGLVFDDTGPGAIEVEVWEMEEGVFGSFVALIPAPLGIGTLTLANGRTVKGFLCETHTWG